MTKRVFELEFSGDAEELKKYLDEDWIQETMYDGLLGVFKVKVREMWGE